MVDPYDKSDEIEWDCDHDGHVFEDRVCVWCSKEQTVAEAEIDKAMDYDDELENVEDY